MRAKEKSLLSPPTSAAVKVIRLRPSTTDYVTFVQTTSAVMGDTGPASRKTKPNKQLLWLAKQDS